MALLAAIVVVTNTVLVSVTSARARIGLRRASGAADADHARVLAESLLMAAAGGVAGTAAAVTLVAVLAVRSNCPWSWIRPPWP